MGDERERILKFHEKGIMKTMLVPQNYIVDSYKTSRGIMKTGASKTLLQVTRTVERRYS